MLFTHRGDESSSEEVEIVPFDEFEEILARILMEDKEILDRLEKK